MTPSAPIRSVCVYCGSSNAAEAALLEAAAAFGAILAREGVRLVYGGGGVGLMGACAHAAHLAGGRVLGVMPEFLRQREILYEEIETIVVRSMHERKMLMFEEADAFVVLPGGIGTLEEVIELISWRRLDLHRKPIAFYNPAGFWDPLFAFLDQTITAHLSPAALPSTWKVTDDVEQLLPALLEMARDTPGPMPLVLPQVS